MANIRTYAEVLKLKPNTAEKDLINKCQAGEPCILGDGTCPSEPSDSRTIRADILRYLLLGGCEDCVVDGRGVWLVGGYITGTLDIDYATVNGATHLIQCHFENRFDSVQTHFKAVTLNGSHIQGWFAQAAKIDGSVLLRNTTASATIDLNSATIGGQLSCSGAQLTAKEVNALYARGAKIEDSVFLDNTTASATIALNNATIGGQLRCSNAQFTAKEGNALYAQGAMIEDSVFLDNTTASATIDLNSATIGGQLSCSGAQLTAKEGNALYAQGAKIEDSVILDNTTASATIALNSATIGGQLSCSGAQLTAKEGNALYAQGAKIEDSVFLDNTTASATIALNSATIGGQLSLSGATFDAGDGYAFWAQRLHVAEGLIWRGVTVSSGSVNLNAAHVGDLVDDPDAWPDRDNLSLDGFTYDSIYGVLDVEARLEWVKRGSYDGGEFYPQPFTQLAKVLREVGHDGDAQKVLTRREHLRLRHQREQKRIVPNGDVSVAFKSLYRDAWIVILWVMHQIFRRVAGYGHRPFRSLWAMLVLFAVTAIPAEMAWREGSMAPNSGPVLVSDGWIALAGDPTQVNPADAWGNSAPGKDWESFSAIAYGLDVVIPIINFGQTDAWAPSTERQWWGQFLYWWRWLMTASGWLVTALGAAAVTSVIRRE